MFRSTLAIVVLASLPVAPAPVSAAQAEAFRNVTVRSSGVLTGGAGPRYLSIAGSDLGEVASYGVARFDVSAARAEFDAYYGAGRWIVSAVTMRLTRADSAFTADGGVHVYFTGDDAVPLTVPSPLVYSGTTTPSFAPEFSDAFFLASYEFRSASAGTVDEHTLYALPITDAPPPNLLADDIRNDDVVTLVLAEGTSGVAATYAGFDDDTYEGPTLVILAAQVPEPELYGLLGEGLFMVGAARAARRPRTGCVVAPDGREGVRDAGRSDCTRARARSRLERLRKAIPTGVASLRCRYAGWRCPAVIRLSTSRSPACAETESHRARS